MTDTNKLEKLNSIVSQVLVFEFFFQISIKLYLFYFKFELASIVKEKINSFYKQPNQLTNILRILSIVIDFIVSTGNASEIKIIDYAVNVLKMIIVDDKDVCKQVS